MDSSANLPIIIENSPVEFILMGPTNEGVYLIIARSSNAGLSLSGAYLNSTSKVNKSDYPWSVTKLFGLDSPYKEFSYVESRDIKVNKIDEHKTFSCFILCWKGFTNDKERKIIKDNFDLFIGDIKTAVFTKQSENLGWYLSPTILLCAELNRKHRLRLRLIRIILLAMTLLLIVLPLTSTSLLFTAPVSPPAQQSK